MNTTLIFHTDKETSPTRIVLNGANETGAMLHRFVTDYLQSYGDGSDVSVDGCSVIDMEHHTVKVVPLSDLKDAIWGSAGSSFLPRIQMDALLHADNADKRKFVVVGDGRTSVVLPDVPQEEMIAGPLLPDRSIMWVVLYHLFAQPQKTYPFTEAFDAGAQQSAIVLGDYAETPRGSGGLTEEPDDPCTWTATVYRPHGQMFLVSEVSRISTRLESQSGLYGHVVADSARGVYDVSSSANMSELARMVSGTVPGISGHFITINYLSGGPIIDSEQRRYVDKVSSGYIVRSGSSVEVIPYVPVPQPSPARRALGTLSKDSLSRILKYLCEYDPPMDTLVDDNFSAISALCPTIQMPNEINYSEQSSLDKDWYTRAITLSADGKHICTVVRTVPRRKPDNTQASWISRLIDGN